jgi:hypothetical protein
MKIGKWNSRKLLVTLLSAAAGFLYPPLVPLIVKLAPTYVGVQGIVDAVKAWKAAQG